MMQVYKGGNSIEYYWLLVAMWWGCVKKKFNFFNYFLDIDIKNKFFYKFKKDLTTTPNVTVSHCKQSQSWLAKTEGNCLVN
jgi:hypothetical protein